MLKVHQCLLERDTPLVSSSTPPKKIMQQKNLIVHLQPVNMLPGYK